MRAFPSADNNENLNSFLSVASDINNSALVQLHNMIWTLKFFFSNYFGNWIRFAVKVLK